jgi:hypothetical protein
MTMVDSSSKKSSERSVSETKIAGPSNTSVLLKGILPTTPASALN